MCENGGSFTWDTADWQALLFFPADYGADIAAKVLRNIFP